MAEHEDSIRNGTYPKGLEKALHNTCPVASQVYNLNKDWFVERKDEIGIKPLAEAHGTLVRYWKFTANGAFIYSQFLGSELPNCVTK